MATTRLLRTSCESEAKCAIICSHRCDSIVRSDHESTYQYQRNNKIATPENTFPVAEITSVVASNFQILFAFVQLLNCIKNQANGTIRAFPNDLILI